MRWARLRGVTRRSALSRFGRKPQLVLFFFFFFSLSLCQVKVEHFVAYRPPFKQTTLSPLLSAYINARARYYLHYHIIPTHHHQLLHHHHRRHQQPWSLVPSCCFCWFSPALSTSPWPRVRLLNLYVNICIGKLSFFFKQARDCMENRSL